MPYISMNRKTHLYPDGYGEMANNAGELNYLITAIIRDYAYKDLSYQRINDVLGALEGAKIEFYRRVVVPYEEGKMQANGDVYA